MPLIVINIFYITLYSDSPYFKDCLIFLSKYTSGDIDCLFISFHHLNLASIGIGITKFLVQLPFPSIVKNGERETPRMSKHPYTSDHVHEVL